MVRGASGSLCLRAGEGGGVARGGLLLDCSAAGVWILGCDKACRDGEDSCARWVVVVVVLRGLALTSLDASGQAFEPHQALPWKLSQGRLWGLLWPCGQPTISPAGGAPVGTAC